jgi:hypothetical protein
MCQVALLKLLPLLDKILVQQAGIFISPVSVKTAIFTMRLNFSLSAGFWPSEPENLATKESILKERHRTNRKPVKVGFHFKQKVFFFKLCFIGQCIHLCSILRCFVGIVVENVRWI